MPLGETARVVLERIKLGKTHSKYECYRHMDQGPGVSKGGEHWLPLSSLPGVMGICEPHCEVPLKCQPGAKPAWIQPCETLCQNK